MVYTARKINAMPNPVTAIPKVPRKEAEANIIVAVTSSLTDMVQRARSSGQRFL